MIDSVYFEGLTAKLLSQLKEGEHLFINLSGENSQFIRINGAKVRQTGVIQDADLELELLLEKKSEDDGAFTSGGLHKVASSTTLCGLAYEDHERLSAALKRLRAEASQVPADPFAQLPQRLESALDVTSGHLPDVANAPAALLGALEGIDVAGIYAAGEQFRAMSNSAGLTHWFSTKTFSFDYSFYTPSQRAVKGVFAGRDWDRGAFQNSIARSREKLRALEAPARRLDPGSYRVFLEPAAVADFIGMLAWGGVSEAALRQGESPLLKIRRGEATFSPLFNLSEDFSRGDIPRFNSEGELAPKELALICDGKLVHTLVCSRTAAEYGAVSNQADSSEMLRAPSMRGGDLRLEDVLMRLGTGIYISNVHYLNWSDVPGGRVTGMTRYACFWVENGKMIAPIENLRFDDTIYSIFGDALEALTAQCEFMADTGSYGSRNLGGVSVPGMLLSGMKFKL